MVKDLGCIVEIWDRLSYVCRQAITAGTRAPDSNMDGTRIARKGSAPGSVQPSAVRMSTNCLVRIHENDISHMI